MTESISLKSTIKIRKPFITSIYNTQDVTLFVTIFLDNDSNINVII